MNGISSSFPSFGTAGPTAGAGVSAASGGFSLDSLIGKGAAGPSELSPLSGGGIADRIARGFGASNETASNVGGAIDDFANAFGAFSAIPALNIERSRARTGERLELAKGAARILEEERALSQGLSSMLASSGAMGIVPSDLAGAAGEAFARTRSRQRVIQAESKLAAEPYRRLRGQLKTQRAKAAVQGGVDTATGIVKLIFGGL